jgi:LacI family transcriptional regulator
MKSITTTIRDVARVAGVAVSTASRALNGHPDVDPDTQQKVNRVARKLEYRPHTGARHLVQKSSETICFIVSNRDVMNPFHSRILVGMEEYARTVGHGLIFLRFDYTSDIPMHELILPRIIWERGAVEGIIVAGTNYPNFIKAVSKLKTPFVVFGNNLIGQQGIEEFDSVWFDNEGGGRQATEYLVGLGHRKIWFVGDLSLPWFRRNYEGYANVMKKAGLPGKKLAVETGIPVFQAAFGCVSHILEHLSDVSAIVAGDDEIALGLLAAFNQQGIKVPDDLSLIGFDDIEAIKYLQPALTTVRVPKEQIGQELAKTLFERLANRKASMIRRMLRTELIIRGSCAPPAKPGE